MEKLQLDNSNFRYERKFFIYNLNRFAVESIILQHPAFFHEIFHERYVNNIYFDFFQFNNYHDNVIGNTDRIKYRIRWYENLLAEIEKPILELKIKKGIVGTKQLYSLNKFNLSSGFNISEIKNVINDSLIDSQVKFSLQDQFPVMINRYRRKYYETFDKKFRITIDDNQTFYKLSNFNNTLLNKQEDNDNVVLELKYDKKYQHETEQITNYLPFRLTKSSKYTRGIELLYN